MYICTYLHMHEEGSIVEVNNGLIVQSYAQRLGD